MLLWILSKENTSCFLKTAMLQKTWLFYSLCKPKGLSQRKTQVPLQLFLMLTTVLDFPCLCLWWTLSSLQKYCLLYSVAGTAQLQLQGRCLFASCVLDYWGKRQMSPPGRGAEQCSGVGTSGAPKWGREGKCSEPRQCRGGVGILLVGQSQALEMTGERRVP